MILADHFGQEADHEEGDVDGDGEVQFADFLILANEFSVYSCNP